MVWAANLAAIELHAPMACADAPEIPRALVFDFDPGPATSIVECCQVALGVRGVLDSVGLEGWCKTSGSKGLPCERNQRNRSTNGLTPSR